MPVLLTGDPDAWLASDQPDLKQAMLELAASEGRIVKAAELSGICDTILRRDAKTGQVEVIPRGDNTWGGLNSVLHNN